MGKKIINVDQDIFEEITKLRDSLQPKPGRKKATYDQVMAFLLKNIKK